MVQRWRLLTFFIWLRSPSAQVTISCWNILGAFDNQLTALDLRHTAILSICLKNVCRVDQFGQLEGQCICNGTANDPRHVGLIWYLDGTYF